MASFEIYSPKSKSKFSKLFQVSVGNAVVISSFNFACAVTDDVGNVTKAGDCAILHKIELEGGGIPEMNGCSDCNQFVLDSLSSNIVKNEPVVQCGELWTHNSANNLSVLSVPGIYMFELCNQSSVGKATMRVEELSVAEAALIPKALYHGEN